MMNWSKAFWKGFIIFLWSILWSIVGMLIFLLLSASIFASMMNMIKDPQDIIRNPQIISEITSNYVGPLMLIMVIVAIFVGIATYASVVKVISDTILDEIKKAPLIQHIPPPPPPPPPQMEPSTPLEEKQ